MSPQMQSLTFTPGNPTKFVAVRSFELGVSGMKLSAGMEVEFDGTMLTVPGYAAMQMPTFRGAIKAGWVVRPGEYDANTLARPVPAPLRVGKAVSGNPRDPQERREVSTAAVEAEEREVGNVQAHARSVRASNTGSKKAISVEEQDARPVGRALRTPARQVTNLQETSIHEAVRKAESVKIEPGVGISREEMLAQMNPEARAAYLAEIEARRSLHYVDDNAGTPQVVSQVRTVASSQKEGITVRNSVGNGLDVGDLAGLDTPSKNQVEVIESEGIKFTTTNGRLKPASESGPASGEVLRPAEVRHAAVASEARQLAPEDVRRRVAKLMCADFPDNYVFDAPERKKIARLQADYDDRPDVIRAVFAAESDVMKTHLLEAFPEVFA